MKNSLKLFLFAVLATALAHAAPARKDLVAHVETCEAILEEFMSRPETSIPPAVWQRAHAILIVNQFKAGLLVGVKGGYGVVLAKKPDGHWSIPVLVSAGETSLGFQIGANALESVYILTDDATVRMLFNRRFNLGVDAKAVAGPKVAEEEKYNHEILRTPILAYVKARGLYAGATVKAGFLSRDDEANFILYSTQYTLPELLYSDWVTPPSEVQPLMGLVQHYAP